MQIFAMIDGRQTGPLQLDNLVEAGVGPDTYVWSKGMADWEKASEVPDICRYFRLRLAGVLPAMRPASSNLDMVQAEIEEQEQLLRKLPPMARNAVRKSGVKLRREDVPNLDDRQDSGKLAVIIYVICTILILIGFLLLKL